jgi:hypothetical protein
VRCKSRRSADLTVTHTFFALLHAAIMPARKAGAIPKKKPASATPEASIPNKASKKRKIDWSTIDEQKKPFDGFKLTAVKTKPAKPGQASKKQKTSKPATGVAEGYRDAPLDADIVQRNPFAESDLSQTHYKVTPAALWESTLRYRKFTSESHLFIAVIFRLLDQRLPTCTCILRADTIFAALPLPRIYRNRIHCS